MNKSELIEKVSSTLNLSQEESETVVGTFLNEITEALENGNRVEIRGFGTFSLRERDSRVARNPKTGESVNVGTRNAVYFRAGKKMAEAINDTTSTAHNIEGGQQD